MSRLGVGLLVVISACSGSEPVQPNKVETTPEQSEAAPTKSQAMQVAAANYNACVRFDDGSVSCWGRCTMGCEARSSETSAGLRPIEGITDAVDVAVGDSFACAAGRDGRVSCWGSNFYGTLGTVGIDWSATPKVVEGVRDVVEVEASQTMTCARTRGGEVFVWGGVADASPPPPDSTRIPRSVAAMKGATALSSDPWGCCAALEGGEFACQRAGRDEATRRSTRSGACGCALDAEGTLRCEARGLPGPPTIDGTHPEPPLLGCSIEQLDGVRDFIIADDGGYAIRGDGELWRWGAVDNSGVPSTLARMDALPKARSIAAGIRGGIFAVDDAGVLWGWGWSHEHGIVDADGWIDAPTKIWSPPG